MRNPGRATVRTVLLGALVPLVIAACDRSTHPAGVTDEQFIEVIVALRHAAREAGGEVDAFTAARERILAGHRITQDQLGEYVRTHAAEPDHLADVWRQVVERLAEARVE